MDRTKIAARLGVIALTLAGLFAAAPLAANSEIIKSEATASFYGDEFNGRPTSSGETFDMNAFTAAHKTLPFGTMLVVTNLDNGKKALVRVNDRGPFVEDRELDVSKGAAAALDMIASGTARVSIVKVDGDELAAAQSEAGSAPTAQAPSPAETSAAVAETESSGMTATDDGTANEPAVADQVPATAPTSATPTPISPVPAQAPVASASTRSTWRIQLGAFSREANAIRLVSRLRKDGFQPAFEKTSGLTRVVIPGIEASGLPALKNKLAKAGYSGFIVRKETW
jgi:rare lipoprotein A